MFARVDGVKGGMMSPVLSATGVLPHAEHRNVFDPMTNSGVEDGRDNGRLYCGENTVAITVSHELLTNVSLLFWNERDEKTTSIVKVAIITIVLPNCVIVFFYCEYFDARVVKCEVGVAIHQARREVSRRQ
jgi:hypothetical protein